MRHRMQKTVYHTGDARLSLLDIRCRTLLLTADARVFLPDSDCMRHSIRQQMQYSLYKTAEASLPLAESGCKSLCLYIRQQVQ